MARKNPPLRDFPVDRGSAKEQERWLAELSTAEETENFPLGGSLILAESPAHALSVADELRAQGHRALVRGVYVRTSASPKSQTPNS